MCKPLGNGCVDSVLLSELFFDKPWCPCPCLTCYAVFQERSKPLLGEGLSFTRNLVFINQCFLTMSFIKIAKVSCKRFPLQAAIQPSQLRKFSLFTDESSETIITKCDGDSFPWVKISLELLRSLISSPLEVDIRSEVVPRRYNQLLNHC